ncbi:unnamed protein product [Triticum turgidum subsp. durum]|uniref:At1g61320/AtMIF1 LRR domain-containing protein n=1 Tax=Triticum turgidum subsp. durum TaxID=4567 RepID=A0A9R1ANH3_TRITD|nr:unnamed protein product [Triticum turgidum subsp. durum]
MDFPRRRAELLATLSSEGRATYEVLRAQLARDVDRCFAESKARLEKGMEAALGDLHTKLDRTIGDLRQKDIWCHIHSLMTLRDAARAACVSHAFRSSWKCYPNLIFNIQTIVLPNGMDFTYRVDYILKNHSGIGVKTFELDLSCCYNPNVYRYLHRWLNKIVVTPGIEKLTLVMPEREAVSFPCHVLFNRDGSSMWYLHLAYCAFHPTVSPGCLRLTCLTVLHLECVRITGDELGYVFSSCVALERLELSRCFDITCLKIPFQLQRLSNLQVLICPKLRMIKIEAPNIYRFRFITFGQVEVSLGQSLRLKNLEMFDCRPLCYALEELASIAPNLETFSIYSPREVYSKTLCDLFLGREVGNVL